MRRLGLTLILGMALTAQAADAPLSLETRQQAYADGLDGMDLAAKDAQAAWAEQYRAMLTALARDFQQTNDVRGVAAVEREQARFARTGRPPLLALTAPVALCAAVSNAAQRLQEMEQALAWDKGALLARHLAELERYRSNVMSRGWQEEAALVQAEVRQLRGRPENVAALARLALPRPGGAVTNRVVNVPYLRLTRTPEEILRRTRDWNDAPGDPTETAVRRALRWLKKQQRADGAWAGSSPPAMTAFALLAFGAHGETPQAAEFGATIQKAIDFLLANQGPDGRIKGVSDGYSQIIATYALCEAYGVSPQPALKDAAVKALKLIVRGQHASGGFNYSLGQEARDDSSVMGWACQALQAGKLAGLDADVSGLEAARQMAVAGFKLNADPGGGFGYTGPGRTGLSGTGAFCMQFLGAPGTAEVAATMKFLEPCTFSFATPDKQPYGGGSQLYYWYYITQAKFHHSAETFAAWNRLFAPELCRQQQVEKGAGEGPGGQRVDIGHWESPCRGEHTGGVVQDTCLCTLMLEVYYRYRPAYATRYDR